MEKHLYHGNSTGLSDANNLISSSVSNLVVFLYESLVCLEVICISYSVLCPSSTRKHIAMNYLEEKRRCNWKLQNDSCWTGKTEEYTQSLQKQYAKDF